MSDDDKAIGKAAKAFSGGHDTVVHSWHAYVRKEVHFNIVEGLAAQLKRVQLGVFHYLSRMHLQRYVDEIVFRRNQRQEVVRHVGSNGEEVLYDLVYRDFFDQLGDVLNRAVRRQVRRSEIGGLDWPPTIAPGYAPAPSAT